MRTLIKNGTKQPAWLRSVVWFSVLCALVTPCIAEQLPVKSYTTADGLARDSVNRIVQDSRGFLWFATAEGLSRFDGYRFTNYGVEQGLPHRNITIWAVRWSCGQDAACITTKRTNVSAAFFLSIEFQQTGYLLHLFQKESFGSLPKYNSFMRDLQEVSQGVVVNSPGWEQKLAANQQQLAQEWVERPSFKAAYDAMSNVDYVNTLYANAGVVPPQAERDGLVTKLDTASESRAAVLLDVAANAAFHQQEQNSAFVLMQYFGYLRRDPDSGPDSDLSGYYFWLNKLNAFNGDYQQAEMVKAFITSGEYRATFGGAQ